MKRFVVQEGKILLVSLAVGLLFAGIMAAFTFVYSMEVQRDIAENVIRFHVMAHDDSCEEQELKELVRTEILAEFADTLAATDCIKETRAALSDLLPNLQAHAQSAVHNAGFAHEVNVRMARVFFPTQSYGKMVFPPGFYEAVQISIGNGGGQNWWCLMFPPLCYVDMTATDKGQTLLAQNVSDEGFRLLMHQETAAPEVTVRFRIVEWWQNLRRPANQPQPQPGQQLVGR